MKLGFLFFIALLISSCSSSGGPVRSDESVEYVMSHASEFKNRKIVVVGRASYAGYLVVIPDVATDRLIGPMIQIDTEEARRFLPDDVVMEISDKCIRVSGIFNAHNRHHEPAVGTISDLTELRILEECN